jgi:hypothetical protein
MKHQIVHTLQKYLLNPPIKLALAMGLPCPDMRYLKRRDERLGSHAARQWAMGVSETSSG